MNETPTPTDISDQIAGLRRQTFTLLLTLIIVSATLTGYLYLQARHTRRDIAAIKPQATQIIQAFRQNATNIESFVKQLAAFGVTHPDFRPVLLKYGIAPTNAVAAPKK